MRRTFRRILIWLAAPTKADREVMLAMLEAPSVVEWVEANEHRKIPLTTMRIPMPPTTLPRPRHNVIGGAA